MNEKYEQNGIPYAVRCRAYFSHALIAGIVFLAYLLLFRFVVVDVTRACAELKRIHDAPHSEIIFAESKNGEESFYYLHNYAVAGASNENALSDVLMVLPNESYAKNNMYFQGTLEGGTCAVSANIAVKYGLAVGDYARVLGRGKTFRVARLLTAQAGLDKEYEHEGIVVLAYDAELLDKPYQYLSFDTDGDGYLSLKKLVFMEDWTQENLSVLGLYAGIAFIAVVLIMAVCELFLFRGRRKDYAVLVGLGERKGRLFLRILLETFAKYLLPAVLVSWVYSATLACYGWTYILPMLCFCGGCILFGGLYSLFLTRRFYVCRI